MSASSSSARPNAPGWDPIARPYPKARRADHTDTYTSATRGKVTVPEPYVWLETPPSQSEETREWVEAQAKFTQDYVDGCSDRAEFQKKLEKNFDYARFSCPSKKGDGQFYYSFNSGLQPQSVIYRATASDVDAVQRATPAAGAKESAGGQVFFDTNLLSKDGTIALSITAFSKSGKQFAYGVSKSGSDWFKIYFRSTSSPLVPGGEDIEGGSGRHEDVLDHVKFSGATWTHDDAGIFYQTYPPTAKDDAGTETDANVDAKLWYHRMGTNQKDDICVIPADPQVPTSMWAPTVSDDGHWLIVQNPKDTDTKQRVFLANIENQKIGDKMGWIHLANKFEFDLSYLTNDGNRFYFMTNKDASNYKLVYCDVDPASASPDAHPTSGNLDAPVPVLHDLVPEDPDALLSSATVIAEDKLLLVYSRDVKDELWQYDLASGKRVRRLMPDLVGTIGQISGRREDREFFVSTVSFVNPGTVTRFKWTGKSGSDGNSIEEPESSLYRTTQVPGINPDDYVSKQVFFTSKDGTRVPMFLTYPKDLPLDGTAPALEYFYGGFNIALPPTFSPSMMTWITEYRGVLAWVNARGGGEYGDKWHEAGYRLQKQNVFDDALAAAKYLVENKYAQSGKVILNGGSNGGLGVAACVNQCLPEHGVGAGIADVGVMDMLKFYTWTIGKAWTADYGNPSEDPAIFDYNLRYSPLHNVDENKEYPTVVLATSDHDDRVVPAHSFKLAAELQYKRPQNANPLLIRIELKAGHGAGKSVQKRIIESADKFSIVARALGLQMRKSD